MRNGPKVMRNPFRQEPQNLTLSTSVNWQKGSFRLNGNKLKTVVCTAYLNPGQTRTATYRHHFTTLRSRPRDILMGRNKEGEGTQPKPMTADLGRETTQSRSEEPWSANRDDDELKAGGGNKQPPRNTSDWYKRKTTERKGRLRNSPRLSEKLHSGARNGPLTGRWIVLLSRGGKPLPAAQPWLKLAKLGMAVE